MPARSIRIIPRLDVKGPNLVKGIHLEGLRVLGRPEAFARWYSERGADELIYMDVVASLYGRNSLLSLVEKTSSEIFIPLTVGGGLRTLDDIRDVLRAGADKIAINTAALADPELVTKAAHRFGSSAIVVSIEAIEVGPGRYEAFCNNGREATGVDAVAWAQQAVERGAGELLVTSVDREGTGRGFDIALTSSIATRVPVPVIAAGGAGTASHVLDVLDNGHADAVALASVLHYRVVRELPMPPAEHEGNLNFLQGGTIPTRIQPDDIGSLAAMLAAHDLVARAGFGAAV
jgi:cyclase